MARAAVSVLLTVMASTALAQPAGPEEPLVSPVLSRLELLDATGSPVERALPGNPAVLRLVLTNAASGAPERLERGRAYIRVLDGEPADCSARVREFRATGQVARTDDLLEGSLILSLSSDNHLSLIDPTRPDARNALAIRALPEGRFRLVQDAARGRYYLQNEDALQAYQVRLPDLALLDIGRDAGGYLHLDEAGPILIGDSSVVRPGPVDRSATPIDWPPGPWALAQSGPTPVLSAADGRWLAVPATRSERARAVAAPPGAQPLAASADGAVIVAARGQSVVIVASATGAVAEVPIGRKAIRAWFASDDRHLLALHEDGRTLAVVDTATARLIQAFVLKRRLADLAFVGAVGFLQTDDATVFRFPVTSLGEGRALHLTSITAGPADEPVAAALPRLAVMADGSGVLASGMGSDRVARLMSDPHAALNGPQLSTALTAIRTGRIAALASIRRGFNQVAPGVYQTSFAPRAVGEHLLVLTHEEPRFSACHRIAVGYDDPRRDSERRARLVLDRQRSTLSGTEPSRVVFSVDSPLPPATPEETLLDVMEIASHWRGRARAERQADGSFIAHIRFPRPGSYIIQPRVSGVSAAFSRPLPVTIPKEDGR